tara:strand:- start:1732 stop:1974 length:243 start_codon:yes stop_codon:yes gene_type:complete
MLYFNLIFKKSTSRRLYKIAFDVRQVQQIKPLQRRIFCVKSTRYIKDIGYMGYSTCRNPAYLGRKFGTKSGPTNTLDKIR